MVLAVELQGYLALRAGDWVAAAGFYLRAAAGRYRLDSPEGELVRDLNNATACWLKSRHQLGAFEAGCELAHLLTRIASESPGRITSVLCHLGELR